MNKYNKSTNSIRNGVKKENMKYLLIFIYLILTVSGLILYKKGANSEFFIGFNNGFLNLKLSVISIFGLVCYLLSFLMYMLILPKFDLNFIYPIMTAISYVSIYVLSIFILNEQVTVLGLVGSFIIMIGVFIANIGR